MFLVVGLGNPGREHEKNRHNVGFRVINALARSLEVVKQETRSRAVIASAEKDSEFIVLVQPLTYVNASGESVKELVDTYGLSAEDLIVVYDDLDLPLGQVRIKAGGSSGGHKGVDSIIYHLDSDEFNRVKRGRGDLDCG